MPAGCGQGFSTSRTCKIGLSEMASMPYQSIPYLAVKPGTEVTIARPMTMEHFESKTLEKTFDKIVFGLIADPHASASASAAKPIKADKTSGPDARSVAEVVAGKAKLKGKN